MGVQIVKLTAAHYSIWYFTRDIKSYYLLLGGAERAKKRKEKGGFKGEGRHFWEEYRKGQFGGSGSPGGDGGKTVWLICCNGGFFVFWFESTCPR